MPALGNNESGFPKSHDHLTEYFLLSFYALILGCTRNKSLFEPLTNLLLIEN